MVQCICTMPFFYGGKYIAPSKTAGMPKGTGQIPRPFLSPETVFTKEHPINLPLRDSPSGAQALTASGGEGRKHSADVHPCACRDFP